MRAKTVPLEKRSVRIEVPGFEFFVWMAPSRDTATHEGLLVGDEPVYLTDENTIVNLVDGTEEEREAIRAAVAGARESGKSIPGGEDLPF